MLALLGFALFIFFGAFIVSRFIKNFFRILTGRIAFKRFAVESALIITPVICIYYFFYYSDEIITFLLGLLFVLAASAYFLARFIPFLLLVAFIIYIIFQAIKRA